jgi:hypothetical protein
MEEAVIAYAALGRQTGIPITLEIVLPAEASADDEVSRVARSVRAASLVLCRVVVTHAHDLKSFQPSDRRPWGPSYEDMAAAARKHFPAASIGGGMMSYFTELNRKRPPQGVFDFITHSICPIVHDASDEEVMQTLESLPDVFASAKAFIGKTPYHLGPSSIGARLNPYGASLTANPKGHRICLAPNDPRQKGTFACAWNLGVVLAAGQAGLRSITLSAVCGPQGLLDQRGTVTPLYKFLVQLAPLSGRQVSVLNCDDAAVSGYVAVVEGGASAWLFNRSNKGKLVTLNGQRLRLSSFGARIIHLR